MYKALVIPVEGPIEEIEIDRDGNLAQLQGIVGGYIEAVQPPEFTDRTCRTTAYVNEEGKYTCEPNRRATDFFVPGIGLMYGDYIAGPLVLCGFDPNTGTHTDLPQSIIDRARLIEREAA